MKFRIVADLTAWTTERLMASLRRQFAYSIGIFIPILMSMATIMGEPIHLRQVGINCLIVLTFDELCIWFAFIRRWRELRRRLKRLEADSNK
jgi:hypothetical protein